MTPESIEATLAQVNREGGVARFDGGAFRESDAIAVLPSAFNPPTRAHLELLREGSAAVGATPAALLTTRNVDKGLAGASLSQRVEMLMASRASLDMGVLATDAARFVDQANRLRTAYPASRIDFIAGYDTLVRIFDERYYTPGEMAQVLDAFFGRHRIVATNRGDASTADVEAFLRSLVPERFRARIVLAEVSAEASAMSSTAARAAVDGGMLTPEVAAYIRSRGLYGVAAAPQT